MIASECRLALVLDYSRTLLLIDRGTRAQLVHPWSGLLRLPVRGCVAPSRVAPAVVRRLALLGDQSSVLVAGLQVAIPTSILIFLLFHVLHLSVLHFDGSLYGPVFLNELLNVDLASVVLLLETLGVGVVVRLLLLPLDAFSRLLLGATPLLLGQQGIKTAQRRLAKLSFARLLLFCTGNVLKLGRWLEYFALNLVVVLQGLILNRYVSVSNLKLRL